MTNNREKDTFEKLRGSDNYYDWSLAAQSTLVLDGLWKAILGEESNADKREKAKARLVGLVHKEHYSFIRKAADAKGAWENLKNAYEDKGLYCRVNIPKQMLTTTLKTENRWKTTFQRSKMRHSSFHLLGLRLM